MNPLKNEEIFDKHMSKSRLLFKEHQYDLAIKELEIARQIYLNNKFDGVFPCALKDLHISFKSIKNHGAFTETLLSIIDMLQTKKQFTEMADYIVYLAGDLLQVGNEKAGVDLLNRGINFKKDKKNLTLEFKFMNTLGNYYFTTGAYEEAMKQYYDIYERAKGIHEDAGAKAAHNLGNTYKKLNQFDLALKYLHIGETYFLKVEDKSYRSNSFCDIGNTYVLLKKFKEAESYFDKAYIISKELALNSQLLDIAMKEKLYMRSGESMKLPISIKKNIMRD